MIDWLLLGVGISVGTLCAGIGVWLKVRERIMAHPSESLPSASLQKWLDYKALKDAELGAMVPVLSMKSLVQPNGLADTHGNCLQCGKPENHPVCCLSSTSSSKPVDKPAKAVVQKEYTGRKFQ